MRNALGERLARMPVTYLIAPVLAAAALSAAIAPSALAAPNPITIWVDVSRAATVS